MKAIVEESDNRQNRMMFKLTVEMAMMMNILGFIQQIEYTMNPYLKYGKILNLIMKIKIFQLNLDFLILIYICY